MSDHLPRGGVYFIQQGDDGPIKVGVAADAKVRLSALQTASPQTLRILAVIGTQQPEVLEKVIHGLFAEGRMRGEWFDATTPGLAEFVRKVAVGKLPDEIKEYDWKPPTVRETADPYEFEMVCVDCGWQIEPELVSHGKHSCWACLSAQAVPA